MSATPIPKIRPIAEPCPLIHDLINDLAIILGECELLEGNLPDSIATDRLNVIRTAARRMAARIATRPCPVKAKDSSQR